MDDSNDVSSNPLDDEHLPVGGEVTDENGDTGTNPDISDDMDLGGAEDEEPMSSPDPDLENEGETADPTEGRQV